MSIPRLTTMVCPSEALARESFIPRVKSTKSLRLCAPNLLSLKVSKQVTLLQSVGKELNKMKCVKYIFCIYCQEILPFNRRKP